MVPGDTSAYLASLRLENCLISILSAKIPGGTMSRIRILLGHLLRLVLAETLCCRMSIMPSLRRSWQVVLVFYIAILGTLASRWQVLPRNDCGNSEKSYFSS